MLKIFGTAKGRIDAGSRTFAHAVFASRSFTCPKRRALFAPSTSRAMDFSFTEEQETISKLARELFERRATPERLTELESGETRHDAALWQELAAVDLLGTALPESVGGNGGGFVELGVLLAEVGWSVAPVPVYATLVLGADPIARYGTSEPQRHRCGGVVGGP